MKLFNPTVHGVIDYVFGALFLLAPTLFGLSPLPATICYVIGVAHLLMSLLTEYPLGIAKLISFPVHGGIELGGAIAILVMPWLSGFADEVSARNFFAIAGVALIGVWATTDYHARQRSGVLNIVDEGHFRRAS